jgi:hypothetical protein
MLHALTLATRVRRELRSDEKLAERMNAEAAFFLDRERCEQFVRRTASTASPLAEHVDEERRVEVDHSAWSRATSDERRAICSSITSSVASSSPPSSSARRKPAWRLNARRRQQHVG